MNTTLSDTPLVAVEERTPIRLAIDELVRFDAAPLVHLFAELGESAAEDTVCAVLADISRRLLEIESLYRRHRIESLAEGAEALSAAAARIGLTSVRQAAEAVAITAGHRDPAALGATLGRLRRVTDRSITEIWDVEDG